MTRLFRLLPTIFCFLFISGSAQIENPYPLITKHAKTVPDSLETNLNALTQYLIQPATTETEKAWALYSWITYHIDYDKFAYKNGLKRINKNVGDILQRKMAVCFGYATLFKAMCDEIELPSEIISGYSKGTLTSAPNLDKPDHAWNAVKVDGKWALLDATWGSSILNQENDFVQTYKEGYFLSSPEKFITNHLPIDPMWQLLDCPIEASHFSQPPDMILQHIETTSPCFNYQDSIKQFRALLIADKKLQEALNAYQFNPTPENQKEVGHSYISYATRLSDQADQLHSANQLDSLLHLQEQVLDAIKKGAEIIPLYDWQKELQISTLINRAVAFYQKTDYLKDPTAIRICYQQSLTHLESASALLEKLPNTIYTMQAKEQCATYLEIVKEMVK